MPQQQYEEVAADLITKIQTGMYPPGSKLPSRRELCEMYAVSDTVVDKAMMLVRMRGFTETLPGVGVYIKERGDE